VTLLDEVEVQIQGVGSPINILHSFQYNFSEQKQLKKALPSRPQNQKSVICV